MKRSPTPRPFGRLSALAALAIAALLATACAALRPAPDVIPDAYRPDGTPIRDDTPAPEIPRLERQVEVRRAPVHLAVFAEAHSAGLTMSQAGFPLPHAQPTLLSLDATIQRLNKFGPGAGFRIIRGSGKVPEYLEGVVIVGRRQLAADFGFAQRSGPHIFRGGAFDSLYAVARLGARSRINLGATGFSLHARGAKYLPLPEPGTAERQTHGWNTEAGISWTHAGAVPLSLNLGYRYEFFRVMNARQEVSGLTLGTGIVLGRR